MKPNRKTGIAGELASARRRLRTWWRNGQAFNRMFGRFTPYVRKRRGMLSVAVACTVGHLAMSLLEPWPMKLILDNVLLGREIPSFLAPALNPVKDSQFGLLYVLVGAIIVIAIVRGVLYYYRTLTTAVVGQQVVADIRLDLYSHIQHLSMSFHSRRRTGDIVTRLTSDIRILRNVLISLPLTIVGEVLLVVSMTIVMLFMDWRLTLIALTVFPGLAALVRIYQGQMRHAVRQQREREGDLATMATESLGAINVVQSFTNEQVEINRFSAQNRRSLRSGLRAARIEAKFNWAAELVVAGGTAVVLMVAVHRVLAGALTPGDLLVFLFYLRMFYQPLRRVSRMAERVARGTIAGERISGLLDIRPTVRDRKGAVGAPVFRGEIRFEGASFGYSKQQLVLQDVDLTIKAGEHLAVVGPTGVGKSTMISAIPRFYDLRKGRLCIDGIDVREFTLRSLREQISVVFQEPVLFATTVAENISYGKPGATREEIVRAGQLVGIDHIISNLPDGYDTEIGERGGTLSGGQRQCVAIARAIIKDAPIVILDEPTAGLDNRSSALVMAALRPLTKGRTVILVTHQLQTLHDMDRIVVLQGGGIVEEGTHAALLSKNGLYKELEAATINKALS